MQNVIGASMKLLRPRPCKPRQLIPSCLHGPGFQRAMGDVLGSLRAALVRKANLAPVSHYPLTCLPIPHRKASPAAAGRWFSNHSA